MKKIFTILLLSAISGLAFSQVTSTVLLDENFETSPISSSLQSSGSILFQNGNTGFDMQPGSGTLQFFEDPFMEVSWTGNVPTNTDSLIVTFKMDKNTSNFIPISEVSSYLEILLNDGGGISYNGSNASFSFSSNFVTDDFTSIADSTDHWFLTQKLTPQVGNTSYSLIVFNNSLRNYEIQGATGSYFGSNASEAAFQYCNAEFPGDIDCSTMVEGQMVTPFTEIKVDDFKAVTYSTTVTGLNDEISKEKEIVASYNLMGVPVDKETKNEMIILKYSDGSSERVFNY